MLEDEPQFHKENNCEKCKYYLMIDSGYGYCRRYPPTIKKVSRKKDEITYQLVEWCRRICGEFKSSNKS